MPVPSYVNSTANSSAGTLTLSWPAHQADDVALVVIETGGEGTTLTPPSGWNAIPNTPVTDVATTAGSKLHCWWRRATSSSETAITIGDSGDHQIGVLTTYRGCVTTGNPFNVTITGSKTTASTTATVPAVTTTVRDTLIVGIVGRPNDSASTTEFSGYTNANLTSLTQRRQLGTTAGHGGGMAIFTGVKATVGDTGTTSVTKAVSTTDTYIVVALSPPSLTLTADVGSFNDTFNNANLVHGARLTANFDAFALTGKDAVLSKSTQLNAYTLISNNGTFVDNGQAVELRVSRYLSSTAGVFIFTGESAGFQCQRYLLTGTGAFNVTGNAAGVKAALTLNADTGILALDGNPATISKTSARAITAIPGAFTFNGQASNLRAHRLLTASTGSIAFTGNNAALIAIVNRTTIANSGSYALAGNTAVLLGGYKLTGDTGVYLLNGQSVGFLGQRYISLATGNFVIEGQNNSLIIDRAVRAQFSDYDLTGQDAMLTRLRRIPATPENFYISGQDASIRKRRRVVIIL